jgi:hypothetical protein
MAVLPEHFDQEKYWLLATRAKYVWFSDSIPRTMEYEYVWCSLAHGMVCWGGRTPAAVNEAEWPGGSRTFSRFLQLLNSPEATIGGMEASIIYGVWKRMNLEWFRPILEKLAAGEVVSYAEANEAYSKAHSGKPLRLFPRLASVDAIDNWLEELEYDY